MRFGLEGSGSCQTNQEKEVVLIINASLLTVIIAGFGLMIAFATLVLKIVEIARQR